MKRWLSTACNLIKRKLQPLVCLNYCIIQSILKNLYTTCIFLQIIFLGKAHIPSFGLSVGWKYGTAASDWMIMQLSLTCTFSTQKELIWRLFLPFFLQLLLLKIIKYPSPQNHLPVFSLLLALMDLRKDSAMPAHTQQHCVYELACNMIHSCRSD